MLQVQGDHPRAAGGAQQRHHLPLPQRHRQSAAEGHQGHGSKETDVGKPRPVLPHPVQHPGEGDEVPGLVVKAFVPLQRLQQVDAAEDEHPVGAQGHQQGGHKKEGDHQQDQVGVVVGPHRHGVAPCQQQQAQNAPHYPELRVLLPGAVILQKVGRGGTRKTDQVARKTPQEDHPKQFQGASQGGRGDSGGVVGGDARQPQQQLGGKAHQQHPRHQSHRQGKEKAVQRFKKQYRPHMALLQPQDAVKAQFLPAALHQKAVDVPQEGTADHRQQQNGHRHQAMKGAAARDGLGKAGGLRKVADGEEQADDEGSRPQKGKVIPAVVFQVAKGQPGAEEDLLHLRPPPSPPPPGRRPPGGRSRPRPGGAVPWQVPRPAKTAPARPGRRPGRCGSP